MGVVGVQLEFRSWQLPKSLNEVHVMMTPLKIKDVCMMGDAQNWKE